MARSSLIPERPQVVSSRSRYSTGGFEFSNNTRSARSPASASQPLTNTESSPEVVETLRHQNRLLAQRNAMIMSKLKELELKNIELSKEINLLKRTTTPPTTDYKQALQEALLLIENKTFTSLDQILQCFKKIRSDEGLPANDQLGILSDVISRPVTSTPVEVGRNSSVFPAFDITSHHDPLLNYFKPTKEDYEAGTDNTAKNKDISIIFEDNESIEMGSESTDLNHSEHILPNEKEKQLEPSKVAIIKTPIESSSKTTEIEIYESPKEKHEYKTPSQTEVTCLKGKRKSKKTKTTKEKIQEDSKQQEPKHNEETPNEKKVAKTTRKKPPKEDSEPLVEVKQEEECSTRRSFRVRKPIDYKPLSMRDKMRRESVAMLDAVGPDVLINYTQKPSSRGSSSGSASSKRKSETPEVERKKRKPLATVNTNVHKGGSSKVKDTTDYDLSVYDFEPEDKKETPVYDKINVKNRIRS
ncbi:uncharacterized protein SPAPADRAFT_66285 [Spathaspora passalidarum NRRL Y-27907]|uniref:Uncharacterized protein n=1 Tax=Spathaspora passalidarum (strain NRRL Y-27907 / 11-Y1) TaxID=619300 RepID=G3ALR5_SPAPN|nr:uncharacterized protein SPAPADRAFT_66285 [Spathaspora passalidarum NRRL Y-27907]EGW33308.1 hypothetical protein SPAPADRAFT_66285 [Spathaspora passalidarum NRRL Y-27907]